MSALTINALIERLTHLRDTEGGSTPVLGLGLRSVIEAYPVTLVMNDSFGAPVRRAVVLMQSADDMSEATAKKLAAEIDEFIESRRS